MAFPPAYNGFSTEQGVTMALSQSQKIIAFLEKHRGGSFTARQIAEAIVQQYASDYSQKAATIPVLRMTRHFFRKSLRKSDHRKTRSKGSAPHSYGRTGPSPAATAFHWKRRRRRWIRPKVKPVNAMRKSAPVKNGPCWNRSFTRFSPVISGRSCTSTPCASGKAAPTIRGETRRQPVAPPRHRGDGAPVDQGMGETRQSLRARQRQHLRPALVV